jgi:hypothetical protein
VVVIACCFLTLCSQTTEIPGLFPRGKFMTPYVHLLAYHIPGLLADWGDLYEFAGQEFEKMNNVHNLIWFRCSSRKGDAWGKPILKQTLRTLYNFEGSGVAKWRCHVLGCGATYKGASGKTLANHLEKKHTGEERGEYEEEAIKLTKQRHERQTMMHIKTGLRVEVRKKAVVYFKKRRLEVNKKARETRQTKRQKAAQEEQVENPAGEQEMS